MLPSTGVPSEAWNWTIYPMGVLDAIAFNVCGVYSVD